MPEECEDVAKSQNQMQRSDFFFGFGLLLALATCSPYD